MEALSRSNEEHDNVGDKEPFLHHHLNGIPQTSQSQVSETRARALHSKFAKFAPTLWSTGAAGRHYAVGGGACSSLGAWDSGLVVLSEEVLPVFFLKESLEETGLDSAESGDLPVFLLSFLRQFS